MHPLYIQPKSSNQPMAQVLASRPLVFALNGVEVRVPDPDPDLTLLSFLRTRTRFTGTKLSCGDGGCGACLVLLATYDPLSHRVHESSINSCLTLLCSIDCCSVTTIEGLGSRQSAAYHAAQRRLAGFHASQCGFCTPGMCIALYSCLRNSAGSSIDTLEPAQHGTSDNAAIHTDGQVSLLEDGDNLRLTLPSLSLADAQTAIVGNICRCTGYRPILDACKSFSAQVDIEDLGINTFWASPEEADLRALPPLSDATRTLAFPDFLVQEIELRASQHELADLPQYEVQPKPSLSSPLSVTYTEQYATDVKGTLPEKVWVQANTLQDAFGAIRTYVIQAGMNSQPGGDVKFVVGNTSSGYYKNHNPRVFIDIGRIPEFLAIDSSSTTLEIGAAITIGKLIHTLEELNTPPASCGTETYDSSMLRGLISHLKQVANPHVRHRASVGGNLIMAQSFSFDSDLTTLFLVIQATLKFVSIKGDTFTFSMQEFLDKGFPEPHCLLQSISMPLGYQHVSKTLQRESVIYSQLFKSFRAAPRRLGNALAFVNAAFLVVHSLTHIVDVKLAFGALGSGHASRIHSVETFLIGKPLLENNVLRQAIHLLKDELAPLLKNTKKAAYRSAVAAGFLFKFLSPFLQPDISLHLPAQSNGHHISHIEKNGSSKIADQTEASIYSDACGSDLNLTSKVVEHESEFNVSGKQTVPKYEGDNYIGKPLEKSEAQIQAAGEAVYVDDMPSPDRCLFAAFVLSTEAFAKIKSIDISHALTSVGVVAFISAKDIPKNGMNTGPLPYVGCEIENLFAADFVRYAGHPVGVVVADSPEHAREAVPRVIVEYEMQSDTAVMSIEDAVAKSSFFEIPSSVRPSGESVGDVDKNLSEADVVIHEAEVRTGGQYYFYMETQTALAIPDEDDCMVVYSSSQSPDHTQKSISACLGIPTHNVRVITRRAGGAFGGKAFRSITVACACAVAAHKLRRPVRMYVDRKTDMIVMGGRHPIKAVYSVGFKRDGKVTSLRAQVHIDGGWSEDFSPYMPLLVAAGLKKYNWGAMDVDFRICRTNLSSKGAMRAPGHVQGSFIADTVMEHVAAVLDLDVHDVITKNMHTFESIQTFHRGMNYAGGEDAFTLPSLWVTMLGRVESKASEVRRFNSINTWRKRGLSAVHCVYDVVLLPKPARVSIFHDGSIVVEVGGIEIGQGLWTKVKQATVDGLSSLLSQSESSTPLNVRVVQADTISLAHGGVTGASTTSEGSCEAVRQACRILVDRLMPLKARKENELSGTTLSWHDLIQQAMVSGVDLSGQTHWFPEEEKDSYLNYGVAASQVELDVLTGAITVLETDLIYDCGKSLNPAIDIGQIEGAFVQGIGFFLTEEIELGSKGEVISNSTWTYKPPTLDNIPQKFYVQLVNGVYHQNRILSSKACGEPPLLLAGSVHSAVRRAIEAARAEAQGEGRYFQLNTPASMEVVRTLCGLENVEEFLEQAAGSAAQSQ